MKLAKTLLFVLFCLGFLLTQSSCAVMWRDGDGRHTGWHRHHEEDHHDHHDHHGHDHHLNEWFR